MTLDVVVPTYNRSHLLRAAVLSLLRAPLARGLLVNLIVVDNNSKDDTALVVEQLRKDSSLPLQYVREPRQGLSNARNAGIAAGTGDLVGFIDDDEEIDSGWYQVIAREFAEPSTSFIGGPYLPKWVSPVPHWLPPGYHAVIGAIPPKPRAAFDEHFSGNLMGGNAVFRREVFEQVGGYAPHLGRSGKGLLSEEDAEFYRRLRSGNIQGMYVPDLAILHHIAPERLTRFYHRRWAFWRAVSQGVLDREVRESSRYVFGVPRHRIGRALRNLLSMPVHYFKKAGKGRAFAAELATWDLLGFVYGKHFVRIEKHYTMHSDVKKSSL